MKLRVLGIVLAGGKGERLHPLTRERAKPAVPFGGKYRIIDFVLSNFINSGIYSIYVLTQFKSQSLLQHLSDGWQFANLLKNQFIIPVPAQMRKGEVWYEGTSDAIFQNINLVEQADPHLVAVFGADHIYRMDISQMIHFHEEKRAAGTVAAIPIPRDQALQFGTMEIAPDGRIVGFREKVQDPPERPGRPGWTLASMGNYVFDTRVLVRELYEDAVKPESHHDFGRSILPGMVHRYPIYAYDFSKNEIPGEAEQNRGYWRDVGTIDAYYEAQMDLCTPRPALDLHDPAWRLPRVASGLAPAKVVADAAGRSGQALNALVADGSLIRGAAVINTVVGHDVIVESGAEVEDSILLDGTRVGCGARVRRAVVGVGATIPDWAVIGYGTPAPPARTGSVRVIAGSADQESYPLTAVTTIIGKSDNAQIRTRGWFKPKVSAAIARKGDGFTVTPMGAAVTVNNVKISGRRDLSNGDMIEVSGLTLEFKLV